MAALSNGAPRRSSEECSRRLRRRSWVSERLWDELLAPPRPAGALPRCARPEAVVVEAEAEVEDVVGAK
jgi:hypothetical protein